MSEKSSEIKAKRRKGESDFSEGGIFLEYSLNFCKASDKIRKKKSSKHWRYPCNFVVVSSLIRKELFS